MSGIVCPIRGGIESKKTVFRAINLARQTRLPLHFMYVIDPDRVLSDGKPPPAGWGEKLHRMGRAVLGTVGAFARERDVAAAGLLCRGQIETEIATVCRQLEADYLVLGCPQGEPAGDAFSDQRFTNFVEQVGENTGAVVVFP